MKTQQKKKTRTDGWWEVFVTLRVALCLWREQHIDCISLRLSNATNCTPVVHDINLEKTWFLFSAGSNVLTGRTVSLSMSSRRRCYCVHQGFEHLWLHMKQVRGRVTQFWGEWEKYLAPPFTQTRTTNTLHICTTTLGRRKSEHREAAPRRLQQSRHRLESKRAQTREINCNKPELQLNPAKMPQTNNQTRLCRYHKRQKPLSSHEEGKKNTWFHLAFGQWWAVRASKPFCAGLKNNIRIIDLC